jgi:hypothetical protein
MQITPEYVSAAASVISAVAACFAAVGVWYARGQLKTSREIAQLQFEDALAREYRDLANKLTTKAFLGEQLSDAEYDGSFDEMFRYFDLSNEQAGLRRRGRISVEVWLNWCEGIESTLALPAFMRAWTDVKERSGSFQDLRRLEREEFKSDPRDWQ